jgi:polyferredoxin
MLFFTALLVLHGHISDPMSQLASLITYIFLNGLFFLMVYTGRTYKYRSVFFITYSFCFILAFITNLIEIRGTMQYSEATFLDGDTPFCHLVIPMILIPAAINQTIIFPGSLFNTFASISTMLVLWLGITLAVGRGWCSWVCFYGGLDDGFSRLCKKPRISIPQKWTYLPHAVLLGIVLTSAATLSATYCEWLCPFKAVTEFSVINSLTTLIQTIIFLALFIGLVIVLPILTGRRTQCGLFCPFASFQSFFNKFNVFDIRIDRDKCLNCTKCITNCPTFSLDQTSLSQGKTLLSCVKCGKCADICPAQAVTFHIKGTPVNVSRQNARLLFLYPAFLFGATMGGGTIINALCRMFKLLTTGSMF